MRTMTRSVLDVAREAMSAARKALPPYSRPNSPHLYTQHQLFAMLVVREFLCMDYRTLTKTLEEWSDLREVLELKRVPHHTTLVVAHRRLLEGGALPPFSVQSSPSPADAA